MKDMSHQYPATTILSLAIILIKLFVTALYVTLSYCLSIFLFVLFPGFPFLSLSSTFTVAGGVQIGRLALAD